MRRYRCFHQKFAIRLVAGIGFAGVQVAEFAGVEVVGVEVAVGEFAGWKNVNHPVLVGGGHLGGVVDRHNKVAERVLPRLESAFVEHHLSFNFLIGFLGNHNIITGVIHRLGPAKELRRRSS